MSTDTELQQLIVYVGTQAKVDEARQHGLIGQNDFVIVTDAPELQTKLTSANAGNGISITEVNGVVKISNTQTSAEWGNILGILSDQLDLQQALDLKAAIADIGNGTLSIQKNGTSVGTFTANQSENSIINIEVPTKASDVGALPNSTKYGSSLSLSINQSTYVMTIQLKDQDGNDLGSAGTVDLPLESVVVNGSYDSVNKKIVLTLQNGNTIDIPVGDLVSGLQTEITAQNKLSADLVDDSSTTNKFVTASDKTNWNNKQDAIQDLDTIRSGASAGATALQPNASITGATKCKITYDSKGLVTAGADLSASDIPDLSSTYATASQGAKADTAVQPATLNDYVTKTTTQDITGQKTFKRTESAFQDSVARFVSTYNSSNQGWRGRVIIGAKDYTFLIGTYNGMAAIGGHKFSDSSTESNADWSDIYFQPDGNKAVYIGGYSWRPSSGWFKVQNTASDTGGKVQVNIGSVSSSNWKDVAYKGENVSDFNNDAGYTTNVGTVTSVNNTSPDNNGNVSLSIPTVNDATLTIQKNGTGVATFTANASSNVTANITVPTDTGDLTNNAGFITNAGTFYWGE